MLKVRYVCSLGSLCHTASWLKKEGLKLYSCPFDWVFSNTSVVLSCLEDNFETFLDRAQHVSRGMCKSSHRTYLDNRIMFNHHDITKDADYNYFVRCVQRFRALLKSSEPKLFIIMLVNGSACLREGEKMQLMKLHRGLGARTTNFELCVVRHIIIRDGTEQRVTVENGMPEGMRLLNLWGVGASTGNDFERAEDAELYGRTIRGMYDFDLATDIK